MFLILNPAMNRIQNEEFLLKVISKMNFIVIPNDVRNLVFRIEEINKIPLPPRQDRNAIDWIFLRCLLDIDKQATT